MRFAKLLYVLGLTFVMLHAVNLPALAEEGKLAVVLVLDDSGSMTLNDPQSLRFTAAKMFVEQLRAVDQVGVVKFAGGAQVAVPLELSQAEQISRIMEMGGGTGEWTDMRAGLELALGELGKASGQGLVILLSDGKPEPGPDFGRSAGYRDGYLKNLELSVDKFSARGWPVYTVGLTAKADAALMESIAQKTGGRYFFAPSAGTLPGIFQDVLSSIRDGQDLGEFSFHLPEESWSEPNLVRVNDAIEIISFRGFNNGPGEINLKVTNPAGESIDLASSGVTVNTGGNYQFITINNPLPGTWRVQAKAQGNGRINAIGQSRYALEMLIPRANGTVPLNSPVKISARVLAEGVPVSKPEGLNLTLSYQEQEIIPLVITENGLAQAELTPSLVQPGLNSLVLWLKDDSGKTLLRKKLFLYGVDQPYLEPVSTPSGWLAENNLLEVALKYKGQAYSARGIEVWVSIQGPSGTQDIQLTDTGKDGDRAAGDGFYSARFNPRAVGRYWMYYYLRGELGVKGISVPGYGQIDIKQRGRVRIIVPQNLSMGGNGEMEILAYSEAEQKETLLIQGYVDEYPIKSQTVTLLPGAATPLRIPLPWVKRGMTLQGELVFASNSLVVEPTKLQIQVYQRTLVEELWHNHRLLIIILGGIMSGIAVLFSVGMLLEKYFRIRARLTGILVMDCGQVPTRKLFFLARFNKSSITLGWEKGADIRLGEGNGDASLLLHVDFGEPKARAIQGWMSLLGKTKTVVILSSRGVGFALKTRHDKRPVTKTRTVLQDGDEIFVSGCRLVFRKHG
ncbi:MAG TPA: VWA domain-containing protein [Verrucomicrobiae bacterium]|nr:VWA domain-containing protein [Verrucomicrobiae bacterium]